MSTEMTPDQQTQLDAAIARRLIAHLDERKDVQNIDLMILADFCRNCLSKWYKQAADDLGVAVSDDEARERIYGMPYGQWKAQHQLPATDEQMAAFNSREK
jgi:hypothetical protein